MSSWKRQHPAAIFVSFLGSLKQLVITLIILFVFGQSAQGLPAPVLAGIFGVILLFALAGGFVSWWKFEYMLLPDELQVKQGLIVKRNRFIRRERVQSIDINAGPIQRIFGLVEVKIETAGGGSEPEFRLIALRRSEAEEIRGELLKKKQSRSFAGEISAGMDEALSEGWSDTKTAPDFNWKLSPGMLLIAAITSSGVGIAATFAAAVISQVPQFLPDWIINIAVGWIIQSSIVYIGGFIVTVLLVAWVFTIISTVLKYGFFTVSKQGKDIYISRGVIETRQLTIHADRVHAVRIVTNLLRQPLGFCAVYVESAGGGTKDEDLSTILLPLCRRKEAVKLLQEIVPEYAFVPEYEGLPKESMRRYMIRLAVPAMLAAGAATYLIPYGYIAFLLPVAAGLIGYLQYKAAGISSEKDYLFIRSRSISLMEVFLPRRRIQDLEYSQNPLQRLDNLHTVHVSVLTTIVGKTFSLKHVSDTQREIYMRWFSYEEREKGGGFEIEHEASDQHQGISP
ncbi:PH domain-containing protein [Bacillus daqingensis]|uniref:PH domain-containing protein n=1 Tax=Bacillus daqingensis TaxID=872396 RepID=A0ABV9NUV1_9BACI